MSHFETGSGPSGPVNTGGDDHRAFRALLADTMLVLATAAIILALGASLFAYLADSDWRFVALALGCFMMVSVAAIAALRKHPHQRFGLANVVTTMRAAIAALAGAAILEAERLTLPGEEIFAWTLAGVAVVGFLLDGVDGYAARRQRTQSSFGARFDMEVDALLILFLSVLAFMAGKAAAFVLLLGMMRYAYALLHVAWPALPDDLRPSRVRKAICAIQVGTLCAILMPVFAPPISNVMVLVAVALLVCSFGIDLRDQIGRHLDRRTIVE